MSLMTVDVEQRPRVESWPDAVSTDGPDAAFLSSSYGLTPDPWQQLVLDGWLGRRADGKWAALTCGLSIPRQNGKNGIIEMRVLYGMVAFGEKFLHSAHEVKTARKAFLRLKSFFENPRHPEMQALADPTKGAGWIRSTNGQETITLANGGSCEFIARTKSSGLGYTVDSLICDEAQELSDEALEALLSTTSAGPLGNAQWIFTGTPPGPRAEGDVFTKLRRNGLLGTDPKLCWHEWSVESVEAMRDLDAISAVNPALGSRLQMDVVDGERAMLTDEGFARQRGGLWADSAASAVITAPMWAGVCDPQSKRAGSRLLFAVEAETDRSTASITVACANPNGKTHLELIDPTKTLTIPKAGDRLIELAEKHSPVTVVIAVGSPAASLVPLLKRANVDVTLLPVQGQRSACGALLDGIEAKAVAHTGLQHTLSKSVSLGKKHTTGAGWLWREDPGTAPLRSATLAHYGWLMKKPRTNRAAFY